MTFTEMALRMYTCWLIGAAMFFFVFISKYRPLLRVEKKPLIKWSIFLVFLTIYRVVLFHFMSENEMIQQMSAGARTIPWGASLFVFWEDMVHTVPIAILTLILGTDKFWKKLLLGLATFLVAISFGLGHIYQGLIPAMILSLYIPITLSRGKKIGFGTIMICHTLYDLVTILTLKLCLG